MPDISFEDILAAMREMREEEAEPPTPLPKFSEPEKDAALVTAAYGLMTDEMLVKAAQSFGTAPAIVDAVVQVVQDLLPAEVREGARNSIETMKAAQNGRREALLAEITKRTSS